MKPSFLSNETESSANPLSGVQKTGMIIGYLFSFYALIVFKLGFYPIPFHSFGERPLFYLNLFAVTGAILFITGGTGWLLLRKNKSARSTMRIAILFIFLLFCLLMVSMLFVPFIRIMNEQFNTGIELNEFWDYWGTFLTCCTFLVILLTGQSTKKSNDRKTENDEFLELLKFHLTRVEHVMYEEKGHYLRGPEAFKKYSEEANKWLTMHLIYEEICRNDDLFKEHMENDIVRECYKGIYQTFYAREIPEEEKESSDQIRSRLHWLRKEMILPRDFEEKRDDYAFWAYLIYIKKWNDYRFQYEHMSCVGDLLYHTYGHLLQPYFKNLYCIIGRIARFENRENDAELLKAQLSRYEISLGLFMILSSRSDIRIVRNALEIGLYNDLYFKDILYFKERNEKEHEEAQLVNHLLIEFIRVKENPNQEAN